MTGSALTFQSAAHKVSRALTETRIRGVKTNTPFILNVLRHPDFLSGEATTSFIADSPELFDFAHSSNRGQKLLNYLGDLVVNGRQVDGAKGDVTPRVAPRAASAGPCLCASHTTGTASTLIVAVRAVGVRHELCPGRRNRGKRARGCVPGRSCGGLGVRRLRGRRSCADDGC